MKRKKINMSDNMRAKLKIKGMHCKNCAELIDYDNKERIINEFSKLPKDKEIIVYCYSIQCMSWRKIGLLLAENGIYVKHLGIGWNEWCYYWQLWNHELELNQTNVIDYISVGKEPGKPTLKNITYTCSIEGGC
ncbi:MAG: hypothetical protein QW633_03665 [Candidatus Aenigmatarchaeota archaeon]